MKRRSFGQDEWEEGHTAGRREIERERESERKNGAGRGERVNEARGGRNRETRGVMRREADEGTERRRGPTSPVHASSMYVHPHARVCGRARANVNVYHETHL